jgi:hypothetical protein
METKSEISYVLPNEMDEAKYRTMSVRFECLVKMFDFAQKEPKSSFFFMESKPLPPQYFKSEIKLTMELVANADPYTLGIVIKQAYNNLKRHIDQYENNM